MTRPTELSRLYDCQSSCSCLYYLHYIFRVANFVCSPPFFMCVTAFEVVIPRSRMISLCMLVFIHSCCSCPRVLGTELVHEFHIFFSCSAQAEWTMLIIMLCSPGILIIVPFVLFASMVRWSPGNGSLLNCGVVLDAWIFRLLLRGVATQEIGWPKLC